jgi:hypothetical protein
MRILPCISSTLPLAALLLALGGCDWMDKKDPPDGARKAQIEAARDKQDQLACASGATYDRLKQLAFDEAMRIRNADPANLDTLATHSVVRMENPLVKARDDKLNVTVCTGRFILELPPGAERGFAGERRLTADVEYAAQSAADGSGLVYQLSGAEPIIYKLAVFDLKGNRFQAPAAGNTQLAAAAPPPAPRPELAPPAPPPVQEARATAAPPPRPAVKDVRAPSPPAAPRPPREAQPRPQQASGSARPSFNCRYARTRSERMVCANDRLASLDRRMSSLYYSALSETDGAGRAQLRRTRDRFLAYRDGCSSEACVADAYQGRMDEIRDIASGP